DAIRPSQRATTPFSNQLSTRRRKCGSRAVKYCAPWSNPKGAARREVLRPPGPRPLSNTTAAWPCSPSVRAAASPARPAPMMPTRSGASCPIRDFVIAGQPLPGLGAKPGLRTPRSPAQISRRDGPCGAPSSGSRAPSRRPIPADVRRACEEIRPPTGSGCQRGQKSLAPASNQARAPNALLRRSGVVPQTPLLN
ncbi:MAG: hypothetical protein ACI80N_001018, partial [Gammaproteobacteria bacterium]